MNIAFNLEIAKDYGVCAAVLLSYIDFWVTKNKKDNKNFKDGFYWTFNTRNKLAELFPCYSKKQISCALNKLKDNNIIEFSNFNKNKYDRTYWYTLTENGALYIKKCSKNITNSSKQKPITTDNYEKDTSITQNEYKHLSKTTSPIPVNNTEKYTINNTSSVNNVSASFFDLTQNQKLDMIKSFIKKKNLNVDHKEFFNYYENKNWHTKNGVKVKNIYNLLDSWHKKANTIVQEKQLEDWEIDFLNEIHNDAKKQE